MRKSASIVVIVVIVAAVIIIPIAIIGADIAISLTSFNPDDIDVEVSKPTFEFSQDNKTIFYAVNITLTTPSLGFIPKSLTLNLGMYDAEDNPIGDPITSEFPIGETKTETLSGEIELNDELIQEIALGASISLTIKGTVGVIYLGFEIIDLDLPPEIIEIP